MYLWLIETQLRMKAESEPSVTFAPIKCTFKISYSRLMWFRKTVEYEGVFILTRFRELISINPHLYGYFASIEWKLTRI